MRKYDYLVLSSVLLSFSGCAEQPGKKKEEQEEKSTPQVGKPAKSPAKSVKSDKPAAEAKNEEQSKDEHEEPQE